MAVLGLILAQAVAATSPALPPDVAKWVERYDECEHWLGEEPYDAARRREIDRAIRSVCRGLDEQRAVLIAKYPMSTAVDRVTFERQPLGISRKR